MVTGQIVNVSLHGLCISSTGKIRVDDQVVARVDGLPPRRASVRWIREGMVGLHFAMPMAFSDLARWLEMHQPD